MQQLKEILEFIVGFIISPFGIVGILYYLKDRKNNTCNS